MLHPIKHQKVLLALCFQVFAHFQSKFVLLFIDINIYSLIYNIDTFMKKSISFKTKFGWISAIEEKGKIIEMKFSKIKKIGNSKILKNLKYKINSYFSQQITTLNFPLKIEGSLLQKKIWKELIKIPYGKTKSYGEIAKIVKTSPRYVGNVCGKNKHLILIPCHRVIRTDGTLGGFSSRGGISLKKKLLILEN